MFSAAESLRSKHMCFAPNHAFSRASVICHRHDRKATGHPGFSLANTLWSMETKHNASRAHQCLCGLTPLLRASFYIARLFPRRENTLSENSSAFQNICHLWESLFLFSHPYGSRESRETIPAHWRQDAFLWDHEFPITSESDIDFSLTLF